MNAREYLIQCLGEEGSELSQGCSKANRFGLSDRYPDSQSPTTRDKMINELNDILAVAELLVEAGIIPHQWQNKEMQQAKKAKVIRYMEYSRNVGTLEQTEQQPC